MASHPVAPGHGPTVTHPMDHHPTIPRGVMRPLTGSLRHGDAPVLGVVDLTRGARCAVGGVPKRCDAMEAPQLAAPTTCWGNTTYVKVRRGGG